MKLLEKNASAEKIKQFFKGKILENEQLSAHTTIKIGGPAQFYFEPQDKADLLKLIKFLNAQKMPFYVIGNGSNLLITDKIFPAAVICLSSDFFKKIFIKGDLVFAGAGADLSKLIAFARENCFSGVEFLAGIPGTIGGATVMNAGCWDVYLTLKTLKKQLCLAQIIEKLELINGQGEICELKKAAVDFGYRNSNLGGKIILGCWFRLKRSNKKKISEKYDNFLKHKKISQELKLPNAGCIFKNPQNYDLSAGALIDKANLKGETIGGAEISNVHANFIVNRGQAKFLDVLELMQKVRKKIKNNFSIDLEPEIHIWK